MKSNRKELVVNTANTELVVALKIDDKVFSLSEVGALHHNEAMLPLIDKLLREHNVDIKDITKFGVIVGPGSFTGIRVGISTIKAFRDATKAEANGINNLDLLFKLAIAQDKDVDTVAIKGSRDSYFVARLINDVLYKYDRNLTTTELKNLTKHKIGMFEADKGLNSFEVKMDPSKLFDLLDESKDDKLIPIYYQLSQAENEKIKRMEIKVKSAAKKDLEAVAKLEAEAIKFNPISKSQFESMLKDKNYKCFKTTADDNLVGFMLVQQTDELAIESVAVSADFRNLGLATKMFKHLESYAKRVGIDTLSLEVSKSNLNAYILYEKLGFKLRRTRKKYYADGSDCFEMIKNIKK